MYCWMLHSDESWFSIGRHDKKKTTIIAAGVTATLAIIVLGIIILFFLWRQRARSRENTLKLTARMTGMEESEVTVRGAFKESRTSYQIFDMACKFLLRDITNFAGFFCRLVQPHF